MGMRTPGSAFELNEPASFRIERKGLGSLGKRAVKPVTKFVPYRKLSRECCCRRAERFAESEFMKITDALSDRCGKRACCNKTEIKCNRDGLSL